MKWFLAVFVALFLASCSPKAVHGDVIIDTYSKRFEYSDCLIVEYDDHLQVRLPENAVLNVNKGEIRWFKVVRK